MNSCGYRLGFHGHFLNAVENAVLTAEGGGAEVVGNVEVGA